MIVLKSIINIITLKTVARVWRLPFLKLIAVGWSRLREVYNNIADITIYHEYLLLPLTSVPIVYILYYDVNIIAMSILNNYYACVKYNYGVDVHACSSLRCKYHTYSHIYRYRYTRTESIHYNIILYGSQIK